MSTFNAGAIESTLTLRRTTWNAELRKLQQELDRLEAREINITVDLFTDNAYVAMDNLERQLDFLDAQTYEPKVQLSTAQARTKIREIDLQLEHLDDKVATVTIDADIANFEVGASNVELMTKAIDRSRATVDIRADVDLGGAEAELSALEAMIDAVDGREIDIQTDVDIASGLAEIAVLDAAVSAVDGRDIDIDVDYDEDTFDRLVGSGGGSGGHLGLLRLLIYSLIALSPILAVAIASGFAAIIAFVGAMAAALGPALLLGAALTGLILRFKDTDEAAYTPGMEHLAAALEAIKDAADQVMDAIAPQGFHILAEGIQLVADILPDFIPLLKATADMMDGVLDSIRGFTQSEDYDRMLHFFGEFGVDMLEDFLKIGGNLLIFFGYLFEAISPLSYMIMDGLEGMTADWAEWSRTLSSNPAFQEFLKDAIEYGPMVLDMLGSLVQALINIGDALEPFAGPLLTHLTAFFDLIANMDTDQLSIALGVFLGLFAVFHGIVPLLTPLINAWPLLAGALGGITLPLLLVAGLIAGLAGVIYYLWTTNEDFRQGIIDTWNKIVETISPIIDQIKSEFESKWGPMKEWIMEVWSSIQTTVINVVYVIEAVISVVLAIIVSLWDTFGKNIIGIVEGAFTVIGSIFKGAIEILGGIMKLIGDILTGKWDKIGQDLQDIAGNFLDMIGGILRGAIQVFGNIFLAIAKAIAAPWIALFGGEGALRGDWNDFVEWITGKFNAAKTALGAAMGFIGDAISGAWKDVFGQDGALRTAWDNFRTWLEGAWNGLITWLGGLGGRVAAAVVNLWDGIRNSFRDAINDIIGWWNNLSFFIDLPDKLPGLPDSITISTPNVPYLAEGAYIDQPTLAMVGEGDEPEIVSPVSKMREVVREVIREGGSAMSGDGLAAALVRALREVAPELRTDVYALADAIAARMLPDLNVDLNTDTDAPRRVADEILFWLRTMGYGGKYDAA